MALGAPSGGSGPGRAVSVQDVRLIAGAAPGGNPDVHRRPAGREVLRSAGASRSWSRTCRAPAAWSPPIVVAKATPDGHILMVGDSGALSISAAINPALTYHPIKDFTPITALATVPTALVRNPTAGDAREFVALAKKEPGKLSYGSAGPGSIHHLTMAIFADRAGIDMVHVPYRGGSPMVNALMTGEIQAGWSGIPNVKPLIESGKLRGYCVSILERSKTLPDVPTCAELGYADFNIATMLGLQGPAGAAGEGRRDGAGGTAKAMREPAMQ